MEKQKLAEFALGAVVLIFGVLIAINFANIDENTSATFTSAMFSRRQTVAPLLRIVDETKEDTYGKSIVAYPQFVRGPIELNNAILSVVDGMQKDHEKLAEENWKAHIALLSSSSSLALLPTFADKPLLVITWKPVEISKDRYSIMLHEDEATGEMHHREIIKTFNYDVHGHRLLTLADLFPENPNYLDQLSGFAYDALKQQLSSKFSAKLGDAALKWLKAGTASEAKNYQEFAVDHGVLILYFGQYQVAAYEQGLPEVHYPL